MISDLNRFNRTVNEFDAVNAQDPNKTNINNSEQPKELIYAKRMSDMLDRYSPNASETLQLAARCQHIKRWHIPRNDYPMTKTGYMQWRGKLKLFHAQIAANIMKANGYPDDMIEAVSSLLKKENLRANADMQLLEDVIVLAFLEHDLDGFIQKHADYTEEKLIDIVKKSYLKMSENGKKAALNIIKIEPHLLPIVQKAIA